MSGTGLVTVGYVHPGQVDGGFHESMLRLLMADHGRRKPRVLGGGGTIGLASGPRIASARNEVVQHFLRMAAQPEWLLMVDSDMVFPPAALDRLLDAADAKDRPIVGGLCFGGGRSGKVFPTLYRLRKPDRFNDQPIEIIEDYPADTLVKVDATGAAFLLMHRDVLVKMGEQFAGPAPWFVEGSVYKGLSFGEDWAFCMRAQQIGVPIHVHTGVKIGHTKPQMLDEEAFAAYRQVRDAIGDGGLVQRHRDRLDGREPVQAPSYVAIPFKGKHEMTGQLVGQLLDQGDVDRIILLNNGGPLDDVAAKTLHVDDGLVELHDCEGDGIHRMWNRAVERGRQLAHGAPFNLGVFNNDLRLDSEHFVAKLATALRADDLLWAVCPGYDDRPPRGVQYVSGTYGAGGLAGFCFVVKGEAFDAGLPLFDEELRWWYGDDSLVMECALRGQRVAIVHPVRVTHLDGGSQTAGPWDTPEMQEVIGADRARFMAKYGLKEAS